MNKSDLIDMVTQRSNLTRRKAEEVVNTIFEEMANALKKDERIEIRGFGSFVPRQYNEYIGRNPRTGTTVNVPKKKLPFFKVGKNLKDLINKKANN